MDNFTVKSHDELVSMQGKPHHIPWAVHCVAYAAYACRFGTSQSASRLVERGGFGIMELDMFHPGWREHTAIYAAPGNCALCGEVPGEIHEETQKPFRVNGKIVCKNCFDSSIKSARSSVFKP